VEIQDKEFEKLESIQESYYELIMAVENKYPNETRHQTALRLIREAQQSHNHGIHSDRAGLGPYGCKCKTLHHRVTGDGCEICNPPGK